MLSRISVAALATALVCAPRASGQTKVASTAPHFLSGNYRRALTDNALRISAIPEGRAVEPAVDAARVLSLCSAMLFPASLIMKG